MAVSVNINTHFPHITTNDILNDNENRDILLRFFVRAVLYLWNKCIGEDTKAAARQSLNCIKNKKINKKWRKMIFNMADGILTPCNVAYGSGIVTVNSPSGSTQERGWHAIELDQTSAILEFYIWFPFPHITTVDISFCTSLRNFIQIGPPSAEKNDVMSIFKMANLSHLVF